MFHSPDCVLTCSRVRGVVFAGASLLSHVSVLPILIATRPAVSGEEVCSVATDETALVRATFTNAPARTPSVSIGSLLGGA